ncbi:ParA family protein [Salmonella enterica]|nr:ParA family protein [Salmonella enterica]
MRIVVAQHKGGVGKTTLAVHVAGVLKSEYYKSYLIDCDSQGDAFRFFSGAVPQSSLEHKRGMDNVDVLWNPGRLKMNNKNAFSGYEHIVVDIDTRIENALSVILEINPDIVLLPVSNQFLSLIHAEDSVALIQRCEGIFGYNVKKLIVGMGTLNTTEKLQGYKRLNIDYISDFDRCHSERQYIWDLDDKYEYMYDVFKLGVQ